MELKMVYGRGIRKTVKKKWKENSKTINGMDSLMSTTLLPINCNMPAFIKTITVTLAGSIISITEKNGRREDSNSIKRRVNGNIIVRPANLKAKEIIRVE